MTDSITSKYIIFFLLILSSIQPAICQHYSISGRVIDNKSKVPMEFVTVYLPENTLWAITNEKGAFTLHKVPAGKIKMNIQYLGYVTKTLELDIQKILPTY